MAGRKQKSSCIGTAIAILSILVYALMTARQVQPCQKEKKRPKTLIGKNRRKKGANSDDTPQR